MTILGFFRWSWSPHVISVVKPHAYSFADDSNRLANLPSDVTNCDPSIHSTVQIFLRPPNDLSRWLLDDRCLRSESQRLGACSVGLRRSEIDGYFERGQIVSSVGLLDDRCLRSESQRLGACSVGLRRSEIDGYFDRGSDRKFRRAIG